MCEMPPKKKPRVEPTETPQETPEEMSVSRLEERAANGDTEAMLLLAEHCAFDTEMKRDLGRAEKLVMDAAARGNKEAKYLEQHIAKWRGLSLVELACLLLIRICLFLYVVS